jgi:hypothetical protein
MYVTLSKEMIDTAKSFREKNDGKQVSMASGCILAQLGMAATGVPVGAGFDLCRGNGIKCQFIDEVQARQLVNLNDTENWDELYKLVGLQMGFYNELTESL